MSSRQPKQTRRRSPEELEALVMDALTTINAPLSAYDIADIAKRGGSPVVPNQVYRTLGRLIEQGRAQRIESLNAYLPRRGPADACLICDDCHRIHMFDVPDLRSCMGELAGAAGFALEQRVVEVHGHCPDCLASARSSQSTPSHIE
jgi:Fur family zinc uptake transcriptional regulator